MLKAFFATIGVVCCLVIGLVVVGVIGAIGAVGNHGHYTTLASASEDSGSRASSSGSSDSADACKIADAKESSAMDAWNASRWQSTFDIATSGLHYNDQCSDDTDQLLNKGYLLSARATAEHYLHSGDWKTDMNEANATLVSCQTTPGLYGTHTGAQCETQENDNIQATTQWELAAAEANE